MVKDCNARKLKQNKISNRSGSSIGDQLKLFNMLRKSEKVGKTESESGSEK